MKKTYYNKLIRDNIPEVITKSGGKYKTRVLLKKEFVKELKKKLVEESKELLMAPKGELVNELSDVLEIIKSIASHYKIDFNDVEKYPRLLLPKYPIACPAGDWQTNNSPKASTSGSANFPVEQPKSEIRGYLS